MAVSNINVIINKDIHKVWDIVFAVEKYSEWRSDLSKTEIINEKQFIEYTLKTDMQLNFLLLLLSHINAGNSTWKIAICQGIGLVFLQLKEMKQIDFTENVTPKKWIMKPFVKIYLKKQQEQFVLDLKKALE